MRRLFISCDFCQEAIPVRDGAVLDFAPVVVTIARDPSTPNTGAHSRESYDFCSESCMLRWVIDVRRLDPNEKRTPATNVVT